MIAKDSLLQGVLKSSRSWKTLGCFMIAKAFAPFSGVKPFAIMGRAAGAGREHARVDAAGGESWEPLT
jgi:hypothetical protein